MTYYIFTKNSEGITGSIVKVAENINDLDTLNINKNDYFILEDSLQDFDQIKLNIKIPIKFIQNNVFFEENTANFDNKSDLKFKINDHCKLIENFLKSNQNHVQFQKWNNYFNQLNNLNLDSITYPLNITLEQYFKNNNQPYFNILQLP